LNNYTGIIKLVSWITIDSLEFVCANRSFCIKTSAFTSACGAYKFVKADVAFRYIGCYFGATAMATKNLSAFGAEKKYRKICNVDL
jgi:hypothetical protein